MSYCVFCAGQDDVPDRMIYNECDIVDGTGEIPCVSCGEYLEIEAEVEKTRQILKEQLAKQREMRKHINRLHDPLLRRVPLEIITQIFELAARVDVDVASDGTDPETDGEIYAPLPLGWICGEWRQIAWSIPRLWTTMSVRFRSVGQITSRLEMAKQWLYRSGYYLPLSIHFRIDLSYSRYSSDESKFVPFIRLVNRYSHRWKDLRADCSGSLLCDLIANPMGVPMLKNLQLQSPHRSKLGKLFSDADASIIQPRSLRLYNVILPQDSGFDWGQISHLSLNCFNSPRLLQLLPLLRHLRDLRISGVPANTWPSDTTIVVHRKVKTLHVTCLDKEQIVPEISKLLNHLTFPSLQHLTVNLLGDLQLLTSITSLIQQSSCNLSSLSLESIPIQSQDILINLISHLNSLEILEITRGTGNDESFLQALSDPGPSEPLPPPLANLRRFTFTAGQEIRYIPWRPLVDIFDLDWCANRPQWKTLSIVRQVPQSAEGGRKFRPFRSDDVDKREIRKLARLVKAGIEVILPEEVDELMRENINYM